MASNDKRRFAFDDTGTMIRPSQGHSVPVELGLAAAVPPNVLFHGTGDAALPAIRREGLRPMRRHHVHLSASAETAGVFDQLHRALLAELKAAGRIDWSRACVDVSHVRAKRCPYVHRQVGGSRAW